MTLQTKVSISGVVHATLPTPHSNLAHPWHLLDPRLLCSINYVKPGRPSKLREHLEQAKLDKEAVNLLCNLLHLDPHKRLLSREAYVVRPAKPCLPKLTNCKA